MNYLPRIQYSYKKFCLLLNFLSLSSLSSFIFSLSPLSIAFLAPSFRFLRFPFHLMKRCKNCAVSVSLLCTFFFPTCLKFRISFCSSTSTEGHRLLAFDLSPSPSPLRFSCIIVWPVGRSVRIFLCSLR